MAYEPTVWKTGDIVSSERLNKIEEGIANAGGGSFDLSDRMAKGEGEGSVVEGRLEDDQYTNKNSATGVFAHAEGQGTEATGESSHAEGIKTKATGLASHAEGLFAVATGQHSHAEGYTTTASGDYSHAEGNQAEASGESSHAEGMAKALGRASHAEGISTKASGNCSHVEGYFTSVTGYCSHAEGDGTIAKGLCQHVFGCANVEDPASVNSERERSTYIEIVGNGTDDGMTHFNRSNARTLDWSGNEKLAGSLTLGTGSSDETTITPAQLKALIAMIPNS